MASELHLRSVCGATTIKQEPMETELMASPKRETEDVFVKEESTFLYEWELPGNISSARDPLNIKKEEYPPSEDYIGPSTFNIEKTEYEEDEEETVGNNVEEEMAPELHQRSVCSATTIKQEPVDTDPLASPIEDEFIKGESLEVKYGASSVSEPERTDPDVIEDNNGADDSGGLYTKVHLTAATGSRIQCTTKQIASCRNKKIAMHLVHRRSTGNKKSTQSQDVKDPIHVDSHEFLHSCSVCHKIFGSSKDLKRNVHLHSGERPYRCGICHKTFTQISHLKAHSLLHTGERPYSCGICCNTFTQSGNLKKHSLLHSGERPYSCDVCHKTFTQSSNLKIHSLLHTGERSYSCDVCNKTFNMKCNLKRHLKLHTSVVCETRLPESAAT